MNITIEADGKEFTFRALTEDEISTLEDKRALLKAGKNINLYDDGAEEIKKALVSPSQEEFDLFLNEYPNFIESIHNKLVKLSGYQELQVAKLSDEIKNQYKFPVIGLKWRLVEDQEEIILFKKISRQDAMLIRKEMEDNDGVFQTKKMKERAKILCLDKEKAQEISNKHASFFIAAGYFLWENTYVKVIEQSEKK